MNFPIKLMWSCLTLLPYLAIVKAVEDKDFVVEHRLSPSSDYTTRGTIQCEYTASNPYCSIDNNDDLAHTVSEIKMDGFYYLRVCDRDGSCLQTFIKQCLLLESNFRETIQLHVSSKFELVGVSLVTTKSYCNGTSSAPTSRAPVVKSMVEVITPSSPAEPETAFFIKQMEAEKVKKQKGETEDNRSFIAKYWMYIVPVVLLVLVMDKGEGQ